MKLGSILKTVGSGLLKDIIPGASTVLSIIDTVNSVLPEGKKVNSETATGEDVKTAISSLPSDKQAELLSKEYAVEIEEERGFTERFKAAMEADKLGNSTRPGIAKEYAHVVSFICIMMSAALFISVFKSDDPLKALADAWPFALAIVGVPSAVVRSYFYMRGKDKEMRYQMASDKEINPSTGVIGDLLKLFKG